MKGRQSLTENAVSQNQFLTFICHTLLTHLPLTVSLVFCLLHSLFITSASLPFDSMCVWTCKGINLNAVRVCASLPFLPPSFQPTQTKLHILINICGFIKGDRLETGSGTGGEQAKRRDEIESDRAEEAEEGGAEIKLNTN